MGSKSEWGAIMATSGEMVAAMAELFGMGTATVESIDRVLSEAGLRRRGGRGRSAAHMTGIDIVNLTFALILGVGMKDAPGAVMKVTRMPRQTRTVQWRNMDESDAARAKPADYYVEEASDGQDLSSFPAGPALHDAETLGEGVAALVDSMAKGEFDELQDLAINLQMNSRGPHAVLVYQLPQGILRFRFETIGEEVERPVFERSLKLDEALMSRLAQVIRAA